MPANHELPTSASGYFGSMAESYDSLIHRAVPRYDEMIARLLEYLPEMRAECSSWVAGRATSRCVSSNHYLAPRSLSSMDQRR